MNFLVEEFRPSTRASQRGSSAASKVYKRPVYDNDNTISLSWTAGTTATGYNIYRNGIKIKDANTTTSYTDSQLTPGQYCYRVTAINVVGTESDSSNIACETVVKPTPINDLAAVYDNDNTISFSSTAGTTATG